MLQCSKLLFTLCAIIERFESVLNFAFWSFDIVSNFVLRISNFPYCFCEIQFLKIYKMLPGRRGLGGYGYDGRGSTSV